ncbi:hypothetical protein [Microbacterium sp. ZXX196]|uniref:hypothetical protein n=1 Tax=Microbacterium sp. ZXX196 TaxID=2609291 RepID=UPI0012B918B7|nr:hypothetical protein [Microbacterium sp. ZXX196]
MSTDDGRPRGDEGTPSDAAPQEGHAPPTEPVPTITGLFAMPEAPADPPADAPGATEPDAAVAFVDEPEPQTDSVRIIAEMFRGFRRRSETPEEDLQQLLGTATQSLPVISDGQVVPAEPAPMSGPISLPAPPSLEETPADESDEVDAELMTDPASDEWDDAAAEPPAAAPALAAAAGAAAAAHADAPGEIVRPPAEPTPEETVVAAPDAPDPRVRTAYVPHDADNQAEQALAWLTAESVATGQSPLVGLQADLVPEKRRRRWAGAVLAPIVTAIILAVAYVVAFAVWPLDNVSPTVSAVEVDTPVGASANLPWPTNGQAAVSVAGTGEILSSSETGVAETAAPMASLTKVITVMVLLDRQPLEAGEDGPSYDFGYLDQIEADALRWQNESALDVPIGGTLTYRQMLEGILMGSAGNYANKLVDALWEGDRLAYTTDAIAWLQDNGITDTVVVDATGIGVDNRSTPTSMVRVSELALANPVVAEIVAQEIVELPGAGIVENSNPLISEDGIVGIKTGHLDEWNVVTYNLTTAKDVDTGGEEPIRVYAAVMGQLDSDAQAQVSRDLLAAATAALQPAEALPAGTVVATATTPWGGTTDIVTDGAAQLTLWNSELGEISSDYTIEIGDDAGDEVGTATVSGALDSDEVILVTTGDLPRPSLEWRLTHPLELLGIGD